MSWCACDVTEGDKTCGGDADCSDTVWQHRGASLTCYSLLFSPLTPFLLLLLTSTSLSLSVSPALCLHHSLCHPLPLCLLTLSSLQEVLELAFSVLYESDEYLNFIAPDKHEVSKHCPAMLLLNVSETEGKSVTAPSETVVYMQVYCSSLIIIVYL